MVFGDTYKAFVFGTGDCFSPPVVDATSDDTEYPLKTVYAQFVTGSDVNTLQVVFEEGGADDGLASTLNLSSLTTMFLFSRGAVVLGAVDPRRVLEK